MPTYLTAMFTHPGKSDPTKPSSGRSLPGWIPSVQWANQRLPAAGVNSSGRLSDRKATSSSFGPKGTTKRPLPTAGNESRLPHNPTLPEFRPVFKFAWLKTAGVRRGIVDPFIRFAPLSFRPKSETLATLIVKPPESPAARIRPASMLGKPCWASRARHLVIPAHMLLGQLTPACGADHFHPPFPWRGTVEGNHQSRPRPPEYLRGVKAVHRLEPVSPHNVVSLAGDSLRTVSPSG